MIEIGDVYILLSAKRAAYFLQKYRDRNGKCIAILFTALGSGVDMTLLN